MKSAWLHQLLALIRLETRKIFFARRGLWIYLLAIAPVLLLAGHSIQVPVEQQRLAKIASEHPLTAQQLQAIHPGMTLAQVVGELGEPFTRRSFTRRFGRQINVERGLWRYTDGIGEYRLAFDNGVLVDIQHDNPQTLPDALLIYAAMFQYFDLRLAIFFGCVGVFTNLFRGEMIDKSLHYYLLTPMRREILAVGKFIAGLIAILLIFLISTALQIPAMLMQFKGPQIMVYLNGGGWRDLCGYLGVTALACAAYGSLFFATGLFFRNPIIPAAVVLLWESTNLFLPPALKLVSFTCYLQSLCPLTPPPDASMPMALRLLMTTAPAINVSWAIMGIIFLACLLLAAAIARARTLQINYAAE